MKVFLAGGSGAIGVPLVRALVAAGHQVARSCELSRVFETLAEGFHEARLALNRLSDSLLHLDDSHAPNAGMIL